MTLCVIDTNVILAANNSHNDLSDECVTKCISILLQIQKTGVVVIDDQFRVLTEYQNKSDMRNGKGVGDVFLKWLFQNLSNEKFCNHVTLTETANNKFDEFPVEGLQEEFDAPDRKFVAIANCHPSKPKILQAADCKWLNWHGDLKTAGITVEFLCFADVCRFYSKKFPHKEIPSIQ